MIVDVVDDSFVLIAGPQIKRRRCNVKHLEPLPHALSVKKGATDLVATDALVGAGLAERPKEPKIKKEKKAPTEQKEAAVKAEPVPVEKKGLLKRSKPKVEKAKK